MPLSAPSSLTLRGLSVPHWEPSDAHLDMKTSSLICSLHFRSSLAVSDVARRRWVVTCTRTFDARSARAVSEAVRAIERSARIGCAERVEYAVLSSSVLASMARKATPGPVAGKPARTLRSRGCRFVGPSRPCLPPFFYTIFRPAHALRRAHVCKASASAPNHLRNSGRACDARPRRADVSPSLRASVDSALVEPRLATYAHGKVQAVFAYANHRIAALTVVRVAFEAGTSTKTPSLLEALVSILRRVPGASGGIAYANFPILGPATCRKRHLPLDELGSGASAHGCRSSGRLRSSLLRGPSPSPCGACLRLRVLTRESRRISQPMSLYVKPFTCAFALPALVDEHCPRRAARVDDELRRSRPRACLPPRCQRLPTRQQLLPRSRDNCLMPVVFTSQGNHSFAPNPHPRLDPLQRPQPSHASLVTRSSDHPRPPRASSTHQSPTPLFRVRAVGFDPSLTRHISRLIHTRCRDHLRPTRPLISTVRQHLSLSQRGCLVACRQYLTPAAYMQPATQQRCLLKHPRQKACLSQSCPSCSPPPRSTGSQS
mmetsp:Transcript_10650/g.37300  ORF Transcript_10650/g.37300 Transcript_10650/m.37300 type:complete len:546 (-) Transcript_10650:1237-2874(-)